MNEKPIINTEEQKKEQEQKKRENREENGEIRKTIQGSEDKEEET